MDQESASPLRLTPPTLDSMVDSEENKRSPSPPSDNGLLHGVIYPKSNAVNNPLGAEARTGNILIPDL